MMVIRLKKCIFAPQKHIEYAEKENRRLLDKLFLNCNTATLQRNDN